MKRIYLDNNATALLDSEVSKALIQAIEEPLGNPSSPHGLGQKAKSLLSLARNSIAHFLKVKQSQILFTSGGSEGASFLIKGLIDKKRPIHAIASNIEHPCVFEVLEDLIAQGAEVSYLETGLKGAVNPEDVLRAIRPTTQLIVVMAANNETGVINDIFAIGKIAETHRIPFIVDGVAFLGKEKLSIPKEVTGMFFSGHKIHAPQGCGFVYLKSRLKSSPLILGGGQEFGNRGGTENMLGIIALSKAVEQLSQNEERYISHMRSLRDFLEAELLLLPGVSRNGEGLRVSNVSNLAFEGIDGETFLIALDQAGVAVSLGSACSSGAIEPSRVLLNMGIPLFKARSSLRFSLSRLNTLEEIKETVNIVKKIYVKSC